MILEMTLSSAQPGRRLRKHNLKLSIMKSRLLLLIAICTMVLYSCNDKLTTAPEYKIIFLHHSTGGVIWKGSSQSSMENLTRRISKNLSTIIAREPEMKKLINKINNQKGTNYQIEELIFPKERPYGWRNYPYDYYNIWVKNAGDQPYLEEPTLEMLTRDNKVIIFKHCFPVSNILDTLEYGDINSDIKTIENYKLQYEALKNKLLQFPETRFLLWTGAAQVREAISPEEAERAKVFFDWVTTEWDSPDDNIYLWDFYSLETEGGIYMRNEFALSDTDSHPNKKFASRSVKLLVNRLIDIIETDGRKTRITGEPFESLDH